MFQILEIFSQFNDFMSRLRHLYLFSVKLLGFLEKIAVCPCRVTSRLQKISKPAVEVLASDLAGLCVAQPPLPIENQCEG